MSVVVFDFQGNLFLDFSFGVDLDDSRRAAFHNHGVAIGESLERVDFHCFSFVPILSGCVIFPDNLMVRGHFDNFCPVRLHQQISVRQPGDIMNVPDRCLPFDISLFID